MKRVVLAASLAFALVASASAAQFYKWKDANGVWQYTTTPPPAGADAKRVSVQSGGSAPDVPAAEPNQTDSTAQAAEAQADVAGDPSATAEIRAKREKACSDAKEREGALMNSAAVAMDKNGDGKAETLSVEEQSAELSRAKQAVRIYCNG